MCLICGLAVSAARLFLTLQFIEGLVWANEEQHVVFLQDDIGDVTDFGRGFLRVADGDNLHAVFVRERERFQRLADKVLGADNFDDGVAFHEREKIDHVRAVEAFGEAYGGIAFRVENVRDAEFFKNARVGGTARFRDDVLDSEFLQVEDSEERSFEVLPDADDDAVCLRQ